jgi:hypothetical protein
MLLRHTPLRAPAAQRAPATPAAGGRRPQRHVARAGDDQGGGIFFDYEPVDPDAAADPEYGAQRAPVSPQEAARSSPGPRLAGAP